MSYTAKGTLVALFVLVVIGLGFGSGTIIVLDHFGIADPLRTLIPIVVVGAASLAIFKLTYWSHET